MFNKKSTTIQEQIAQLQKRGLQIPNVPLAEKYLANISYYRLGEYWYVMQEDKENHTFKPNSRFTDVVALYNFGEITGEITNDDLLGNIFANFCIGK